MDSTYLYVLELLVGCFGLAFGLYVFLFQICTLAICASINKRGFTVSTKTGLATFFWVAFGLFNIAWPFWSVLHAK